MRRFAAGFLGAGLALVLWATPALAHANLVRSDPAADANLDQPPSRVEMWFSERPEPKLSDIQVFDGQRQRVDVGSLAVAPDDAQALTIGLQPNLPQGVYTVSWKTTSAVDGHVVAGALAFGFGVAPTPADIGSVSQLPSSTANPISSAIIRWLSYVAATGLLGLVAFGLLAPQSSDALPAAIAKRLKFAARALAGLLCLSAFGLVLDQTSRSAGSIALDAISATAGTSVGQILVARLGLGAFVLVLLSLVPDAAVAEDLHPHRSLGAAAAPALRVQTAGIEVARAALTLALLAFLFLFAFTSHAQAVSNAPDLALFVDWLHLTFAGIWIGGLLALAVGVVPVLGSRTRPQADIERRDAERNTIFGPILASFSRVALISVAGLGMTGFYQALVHVGSLDNVLTTSFGQTLLVKTAIFGLALLLAGFHRWLLIPAFAQPGKTAATRARRLLSRTLPAEALLVVGVLAATGVLTTLAPANNQASSGAQVRTLGQDRVGFQVAPLRAGPNLFQVELQAKGQPVTDANLVELRITSLDMDMGQSVLDLHPTGQGVYAAQGDLLSMSGRWHIELLLRLPGQFDQTTTFDVKVSP